METSEREGEQERESITHVRHDIKQSTSDWRGSEFLCVCVVIRILAA